MRKRERRVNNIKFHILYIAIIAILSVVLGISFSRPIKEIEVVKHITDTTTIEKVDTLIITKIKEVEKVVTDTTYLVYRDSIYVPIPMSEYRFYQKGLYDITAHGYNVSLSNVAVYPKTVTHTVTNTIEKEIIVNQWDIYLGGGIWRYGGEWIPNISATIKAPKNLLFGVNLGYYDYGLLFGGSVQYKLTHQK